MALGKGAQSYRFAGGISTKQDPKTVPATQLLVLENGVFTRATSIAKRFGYEDLGLAIDGSTVTVDGLIRLAERDDELLAFTPTRCYSRGATASRWSDTGSVYSVVGSDRPIVRTGTEQTMPDHASLDGVSVFAWEDSRGGVWYTVTDTSSGRIHIAATQADAAGISPRCVAAGPSLHVYFANPTAGLLRVIVVNPAEPGVAVAPTVLAEDLNTANPVYDAIPSPIAGTPALIAWHENGSNSYRVGYVHSSGVLGSPLVGLPTVITETNGMSSASPIAIAHTPASPNGAVITVLAQANGSSSIVANIYNESIVLVDTLDTVSVTSPQRIAAAWTTDSEPTCWLAVEEAAAQPSNRFCTIASFTEGTSVITPRVQRSVGLASRAWAIDDSGDVFAFFLHDTTYFNVYVALRLSDSLCVARALPGLAGGGPARKHLSSAHVDGTGVAFVLPYAERLESSENDRFSEEGVRLLTLAFVSEDSHQAAQIGRGLTLAGACPQHYDGRQWVEQGFHVGPELIATANGTSGSLTPSSTYLYRAWYEWTDAQGEIHRGPVSFGTLVTLGPSDDEVTLTLPTLRITAKSSVRICVARSRAAETGATAELFRATSSDPGTVGAPNGYVANNPTADTVTFNDRMSDAVLATQEPLYTNGGVLSNDPCALGSVIARSKRRLFMTDPADPYTIRFSQELDDGYAAEFAPELVVRVDPAGGAVSGLADMDGQMIVYQERAIRTFGGGGPTITGDTATGGFSEPRRLTTAVGCTDPASIVETDAGHIFDSDKGLWLVDRSGQVSYVGALAEAFNAQRTTASSLLPARTSVVFLTDDGTTLLYDYLFGQWSTFTNHLGRDAAVVGGVYHYLRTDGRVFRETVGSYSDAGQQIRIRLETAWIHLTEELQGFQRFYDLLVLGTWISPHQLAISHRTDYEDQWTDQFYLDATGEASSTGWVTGSNADAIGEDPIGGTAYGVGIYGDGPYGGTGADVYQWRYHIGGRGQSVRFRFDDFERADLTPGASFELTEMQISGGLAGPSKKPFTGPRSG